MTRRCVVPGCKTGLRSCKIKWSIFRVPQNFCDLQKWAEAIPGIDTLEPKHFVCEKHFDNKYIHREWVKRDSNNRIIAQSPYQRIQLDKRAIPTEFDDSADIEGPTHSSTTIVSEIEKNEIEDQGNVSDESILSSIKFLDPVDQATELQFESSDNLQLPHDTMTSSTQNVYVDIKESPDDIRGPSNVELPVAVDVGDSRTRKMSSNQPVMEVACSQTTVRHTEATSSCVQPLEVYSTVVLVDTGSGNYEECFLAVPKPWSILHVPADNGQRVTFALAMRKRQNDITVSPIIQKCVTLNADRTINYHVYGRLINTEDTGLENNLLINESFPNVLKRFQQMNVCHGLGAVDINHLPHDSVIIDNVEQWRSMCCTLLSKKRRSDSCAKTRKRALQNMSRLQSRRTLNRISKVSNSVDQYKLAAMRKKVSREQRQKNRAKKHVQHLTNCLKKQEKEIASMKLATLDKKCSELNVPPSQKAALKEIIAAASTDVRGRRYRQEWIMLCMLMNIRSPGYYEFLRKNNVLPLPCTRTIRTYLSLIDSKCGFDVKFAEILKKQFATKSPLQRNGVLLVDEINLRKSVAVCSKDLTYVGLTDLGDDGEQSTDINDQATHGLVLLFQSLADSYSQPFAVFASKNPVKGEELSKIVIKGISYLEGCGARVHGVVADGAATNAKMWSILGISGSLEKTNTSFTHPLDDKRKVFVFSDTPHLVKNIRNRLYNKKKLRLKSTENYVCWEYFKTLYDVDKNHPGNLRACPKITDRHIILDNMSKMRVRLATQIFSNSVAQGLAFYQSHGCDGLRECEETIFFCKRVNDMFDALNRKSPNQGITPQSKDFKVLEDSLQWLNDWESAMLKGDIGPEEFLTNETSRGLRISLQSTMDMCRYLIEKFQFEYLLSGKVNQDNLEKFFGTIRQAAGANDHPNCPTFLQLYKLLSIYSVLKPPKCGNCTILDNNIPPILISIDDLKKVYGDKGESKSSRYLHEMKKKLDSILKHNDWEADDIIDYNSDHDYTLFPIVDCIIYYVTGYLCKQILKRYKSCAFCEEAVRLSSNCISSVSQLVQFKSHGGLIHANLHFFHLIRHVETLFAKYASRKDVFDLTIDHVLESYTFTFPCTKHASEILSYAIIYYIRLRMRQSAHQENIQGKKQFAVKKKLSKLTTQ